MAFNADGRAGAASGLYACSGNLAAATTGGALRTPDRAEPAWMMPCREELMQRDPRYLALFNIRWRRFNGDCTAAQLHRFLRDQDYDWAPTGERTVRRWLREILPVEAKHQAAAMPAQS